MKKIVEKKTKGVYPSMPERLKEYGKAKTPPVKKMKK